jgi:glycosyltransferase involved in cell wall biosynthesis
VIHLHQVGSGLKVNRVLRQKPLNQKTLCGLKLNLVDRGKLFIMFVSAIIPTRNRSAYLRKAITSVQEQHFAPADFEIIVADNGSSDETSEVIRECNENGSNEVIRVEEPRIGLHNARHAGAKAARGQLLVYTDDDVICEPDWLYEITKLYSDPAVTCVGGKIAPLYAGGAPRWAEYFPGFISILDNGNRVTEVGATDLYGCNLSIRRDVLFAVGGFNPDAMPSDLIRFRGDGETGLLLKLIARGHTLIYTPRAEVTHVIPKERTTIHYFRQRAFNQGISDSYTAIRNNRAVLHNDNGVFDLVFSALSRYAMYGRAFLTGRPHCAFCAMARRYALKGMRYHQAQVAHDPKLLEYVLKEDYLNADPPQ